MLPSVPSARDRRARSVWRRTLRALGWLIALGVLSLNTAWTVSGWSWSLDIAANLTAQWVLAAAIVAVVLLLTGPKRAGWLSLGACCVGVFGLMQGRAAILPRPMVVEDRISQREPDGVRVLHYNASALGTPEEIIGLIRMSDADVVSIACPPPSLHQEVLAGAQELSDYQGRLVRTVRSGPVIDYVDVTAAFLLTRWAVRPVDTSWLGESAEYLLAGIVQRPRDRDHGGPFAVVAFHPRSPRNAERWEFGNALVEAVSLLVNRFREQGLEVVVLTDLNATPTGYRSQFLRSQAGLRRTKPLLTFAGTYPLPVTLESPTGEVARRPAPWPAALAIDDALVTGGSSVVGWMIGTRMSSGHRPVVADLLIPRETSDQSPDPAGASPSAGR